MTEVKVTDTRRNMAEAAAAEKAVDDSRATMLERQEKEYIETQSRPAFDGTFRLDPMPSRLIIKEDLFIYKGRVIIPDAAQRRPTTGTVIAVGAEITKVAVGDKILYGNFSGTGINFANRPAFRILTEDEILAIVVGDEKLEGTAA